MCVEEVGVDFADTCETIINNPVFPFVGVFFYTLTRLRPGPPDGVGKHGTDGDLVRSNGSIRTEEVVEEVGRVDW